MAQLPVFPVEPGEEGSGELVAEGEATQDDNPIDSEQDQQLAAAALLSFLEAASDQISITGSIVTKAVVERAVNRALTKDEFQAITYSLTSYMNSVLAPIFTAVVVEIDKQIAEAADEE